MQAASHVLRPGWAQCAGVGSFETTLTGQGGREMIPGAANEMGARRVPGRDLMDTKRAASSGVGHSSGATRAFVALTTTRIVVYRSNKATQV